MFEIMCPGGDGDRCLTALSAIVSRYVEEETTRSQEAKAGDVLSFELLTSDPRLQSQVLPHVTRIPESIVVKASFGSEDGDDEGDLGRDIDDESQSGGNNDDTAQASEAQEEGEEGEPEIDWSPEDGVDLQKLATREVLNELQRLTGCKLNVDDTGERILIFSKDNHVVSRAWEKLGVLQEEFVSIPSFQISGS